MTDFLLDRVDYMVDPEDLTYDLLFDGVVIRLPVDEETPVSMAVITALDMSACTLSLWYSSSDTSHDIIKIDYEFDSVQELQNFFQGSLVWRRGLGIYAVTPIPTSE